MSRLSLEEVREKISRAIKAQEPFSALRLGDGEGRVIGYPEHVPLNQISEIWKTWFGHSFFTDIHINYIKSSLKEACLGADIIGLPIAESDLGSDFGRVEPLLRMNGYINNTTEICNSGFHLDLQHASMYESLLGGIDNICVVGSRNISHQLKEKFDIGNIHWIQLPPEMRFSGLSNQEKLYEIILRPHFTEVFFEVINFNIPQTFQIFPKPLFLVGGGILGKLYCHRIKSLGGVAIDVGSMMDLWGGLKTRENIEFEGLHEVIR